MRKYQLWRSGIAASLLIAPVALADHGDDATLVTPQARQSPQHMTRNISKTIEVSYLLYLPPDYNDDPAKRWPMILFLHGAGERGDDLDKVKAHGPPKYIAGGRDYPFVIVSPQCPADQWWDPDVLLGLLDGITEQIRVDPERIYLTGLSMGGYGTWLTATRRPERFAAIAPVCGGGRVSDAHRLKHVPVWAFHGEKDTVVPPAKSKEMVDAVNKAGGNARLTLYPDAGHDSWTLSYENSQLYEWLLSHRRDAPSP